MVIFPLFRWRALQACEVYLAHLLAKNFWLNYAIPRLPALQGIERGEVLSHELHFEDWLGNRSNPIKGSHFIKLLLGINQLEGVCQNN